MSLKKKIARSSLANLFQHAAMLTAMLVVTPVTISSIGLEKYGLWLLLMAAMGLLEIMDGGITLSGTRFLGRKVKRKEEDDAYSRTYVTLRWLYRRVALIMVFATILLVVVIPFFVEQQEMQNSARWILAALGLSMAVRFWLRIHLVVLKSHLRYDLIVTASIAKLIFQSLLLLFLLSRGYGLMTLASVYIASDVLDQFLVVMFSHRTTSSHGASVLPDRALMLEILRSSSVNLVNNIARTLRSRLTSFVISNYSGLAFVPIYNIGIKFLQVMSDLVTAMMGGALLSGFSQIEGSQGLEGVRKGFLLSLRVSVPFAVLGAGGIALIGPAFIECWLGPDFANSGSVLLALVIPYTLLHMQAPALSLLVSLDKHKWFAVFNVAFGLLNFIASIFLAIHVGFYGIIMATSVDMVLYYGIVLPIIVCRELKITLGEYYLELIRPIVRLAVFIVPAAFLLRPFVIPQYLDLMAVGFIYGMISVMACLVLLINASERKDVFRLTCEIFRSLTKTPWAKIGTFCNRSKG